MSELRTPTPTPTPSPSPAERRLIGRWALAGVAGAAVTVAGAVASALAASGTTVADDRWSWPFSTRTHVLLSAVWFVTHVAVALGLVALRRSGLAGRSRSATRGLGLAVAGTVVLAGAEVASMWVADATESSGKAMAVGAVFGVGTLLSAVGLLVAGVATLRSGAWSGGGRFTPLVAGVLTLALAALVASGAFFVGIAAYGLGLLALTVALHRAVPTLGSVAGPAGRTTPVGVAGGRTPLAS